MSDAAGATFTAFRYMSRFRCIGPECEATCCSGGWAIVVDRSHYKKTQKAMQESPASRQEFDEKVKRVKGVTQRDARYALMVLQDSGACSFLTEERLCGLQQRYGERVLSDTCATYPRIFSQSGERVEMTGVTSCPEVARQLLLHPDALELDAVPAPERVLVSQRQPERPAAPYVRYHDELRNLVMDLLSDVRYTLASRLSMVSYFASRISEFVRADSTSLDEERLVAEVTRIQSPAVRADLDREFRALSTPVTFALRIVLALSSARMKEKAFEELRASLMVHYNGGLEHAETMNQLEIEQRGAQILRTYTHAKTVWARFAPRIDGYLTNFAKNYWAREWYARSPDMLTHTFPLLIRIAMIRFVLFGHPLLAAALELPDAERERVLDRAVVDVVYKISRPFEHDPALKQNVSDKLAEKNLISLAHAVGLAFF